MSTAVHTLPPRYQAQVSAQLHAPKIVRCDSCEQYVSTERDHSCFDAKAERNAKLSAKGRKAQTAKAAMREAKADADREWLQANAHCGEWVREHVFAAPERKWRFDFACLSRKVAVECEGGIFTGGAHGSVSGILRDVEKYNEATARGWRVVRVQPKTLRTPETLALISRCCTANISLP